MDQGSQALRVAVVGAGTIGRAVAKAVQADAEFRLVGVVEISEAAARDAVDAFGGVPVTNDVEALAEADVAVVAAGRRLDRIAPTLRQLMARKIRIVSDCAELAWPWLRHPHLSDVLANEATKAGVPVVGTGAHPGVLSATLPLLLASMIGRVSRVSVKRHLDLGTARPSVHRQAGLGLTSDQFRKLATDGVVGLPGTGESVVLIAQGLGRHPMRAEVRTAIRPIVSEETVGRIKAGRVSGVRQHSAWSSDDLEIDVEETAAFGGTAADSLEIAGERTVRIELPSMDDVAATAALLVNAARILPRVPAGLRTALDLPPVGSR